MLQQNFKIKLSKMSDIFMARVENYKKSNKVENM